VFGQLSIVSVDSSTHLAICTCTCGKQVEVKMRRLIAKEVTSCGCWKETSKKFEATSRCHRKSPLYSVWVSMIQRTTNPKSQVWDAYGGRGITTCEDWRIFDNFYFDMCGGYTHGLSLDRIDTNKGYSKDNCRWASRSVQNHNKRKQAKKASSQYLGVFFNTQQATYQSSIKKDGESTFLGSYEEELSAAIAYDNASEMLYGDRPNKTQQT